MQGQVWDGGAGTGAWGTAANWNPNSVPGNAASLIFNGAAANGQHSVSLQSNRRAAGITFSNAVGANGFTFSGNTLSIDAGGITNNDADTQTFNSAITVRTAHTWNAASGALVFDNVTHSQNLTLSGAHAITVGGTFTQSSNRTLTNNNSSGAVSINNITFGSTLTVAGTGATAVSGTITMTGNRTLTNNSTGGLTISGLIQRNSSNRSLTLGGTGDTVITGVIGNLGAGTVTKSGTGTLTLLGANTYVGNTSITGAGSTLIAAHDSALGAGAGITTVGSGATLALQGGINLASEDIRISGTGVGSNGAIQNLSGNNTLGGPIILNAASQIGSLSGELTISGTINRNSGNRALTFVGGGDTRVTGVIGNLGTGTVTKEGSGTLTLAGSNTYTGQTNVNAGTLVFGAANVLNSSNLVVTASGAIVDLNGFNQTLGGVSGTGTLIMDGANLTLTGSSTFSGVFTGAGTVIINAGASLTLGADFNNNSLDIVLNGGTLFLGDRTSTFGSLTVQSNSILDFGGGSSIVGFTTGVTANAQLLVQNWVNTVDFFYSTLSPGTQGASPLDNIVFTGFGGNDTKWLSYTDGPGNNYQITPVPEPSVYGAGLMAVALGVLACRRRRRG